MTWNEVLPILPTARDGWADFDGKDGTPIKDHPLSSLDYWPDKSKKVLITVMFEKGVLNGIILGYLGKDPGLAESVRTELEQELGQRFIITKTGRDHLEVMHLEKDGTFYDLYTPDKNTPRGGGIALRVISKEEALALEKKAGQGATPTP